MFYINYPYREPDPNVSALNLILGIKTGTYKYNFSIKFKYLGIFLPQKYHQR